MKKVSLKLIRFYQKTVSVLIRSVNPHFGCRFYPSCSEYCCQAIKKYGFFKGWAKGIKRIIKCNPFNSGGIDLC